METKADGSDGSLVLIKQGAEAEVYYQGTVFKEIQASDFGLKATLKRLNAVGVKPFCERYIACFGLVGVDKERMADIATQIGNAIGKLHDGGLVHGDLTTSNMLLRSASNQLVLIDFGLSFTSTLPEDKAVDLYVLERALLSMHSSCGNVMDHILAAYRKSSKQWSSTLNKLAEVRLRKKARNGWLTSPSLQTPR
ncbi:TP53-regulating kinase [Capsicum chinense]|nr:TP53-regulating kinase [Capsicum chinense]